MKLIDSFFLIPTRLLEDVFGLALRSICIAIVCCVSLTIGRADEHPRRPKDDAELATWLENMVWYHHFSLTEIEAATGLSPEEVKAALARLDLRPEDRPPRGAGDPLLVLPYPGGRHPRRGFRDGAINPQRETKISVFLPWDPDSYVVADIPEAIWSNLGLTYLAHTHVDTLWTKQDLVLEPLEWKPASDRGWQIERTLPNGIAFGASVHPKIDSVRLELWLRNGTNDRLTGLRIQNCVLLAAARGFDEQTNANKVFNSPYCAVHDARRQRWIVTAWDRCQRAWGNERCPCLHSDPQFPDCDPGQTERLNGWLSFYEGTQIEAEIERIEAIGWRTSETK